MLQETRRPQTKINLNPEQPSEEHTVFCACLGALTTLTQSSFDLTVCKFGQAQPLGRMIYERNAEASQYPTGTSLLCVSRPAKKTECSKTKLPRQQDAGSMPSFGSASGCCLPGFIAMAAEMTTNLQLVCISTLRSNTPLQINYVCNFAV